MDRQGNNGHFKKLTHIQTRWVIITLFLNFNEQSPWSHSSKTPFSDFKIQRILKIDKGKFVYDPYFIFLIFYFFYDCFNRFDCCGPDTSLDTKINHIDLCHISMSYASFFKIWHFMSYDAYDIKIWLNSIWSILVSKEVSGPQQSHPLIQFWL